MNSKQRTQISLKGHKSMSTNITIKLKERRYRAPSGRKLKLKKRSRPVESARAVEKKEESVRTRAGNYPSL